jgi:hypothetical protein
MSKLYLSLIGPVIANLQDILDQFALPCEIYEMTRDTAWEELTKIGLYRSGPGVSQVGTTWLEELVATDAVRSFTDEEVDSMGGGGGLFPHGVAGCAFTLGTEQKSVGYTLVCGYARHLLLA